MLQKNTKGHFSKGYTPWNKGLLQVDRRSRVTLKCKDCREVFEVQTYRSKTANFCSANCRHKWLKGKNLVSEESRKAASQKMTGEKHWNYGNKYSEEFRKVLSYSHRGKKKGEENPNWKGGATSINKLLRSTAEYKDWRKFVFQRDDYTCVNCGSRGVHLHADHIKPFAYFPDLRLKVENGRTLCFPCHRKTDTFAGRSKKYECSIPLSKERT